MRITFLGTGTSQGIPVIGCSCKTCLSRNTKDQRLRCSIYVEHPEFSFIVDAGPDFRTQVLRNNIKKLDFILLTHEHNDHTAGLDDIRPFNYMQKKPIKVIGLRRVLDDIKRRFAYAFEKDPYPGAPEIELIEADFEKNIKLDESASEIIPVQVMHGKMEVLGFRLENFAYLTDMLYINETQFKKIAGVDFAVISMLHRAPHHAHMNWDQALQFADKLKAKKTYLIHMSHRLGPLNTWENFLPLGVYAAYDGLQINI